MGPRRPWRYAATWATAAALLCGLAPSASLTAAEPAAKANPSAASGSWKFVKPNEPGASAASGNQRSDTQRFAKKTNEAGSAANAKLSWKRPGLTAPANSAAAPVRQVAAHERLKQDKLTPQRDVNVSPDDDDPFENPFDDGAEEGRQAVHLEPADEESNCQQCAKSSRIPDATGHGRVQRAGALEDDELPPPFEEDSAAQPVLPLDTGKPPAPTNREKPAPLSMDEVPDEDGGPDLPESDEDQESAADVLSRELAQAPGAPTGPCPSPADLKKITEITDNIRAEGKIFPQECTLGGAMYTPRNFALATYTWKASALCHKPLYFEQVAVERYGHTWPLIQPVMSAAHFFCTVPILPYKMGIEPPTECIYALGYYEPGSCAPYMIYPIPITARAALLEAGAWIGGIYLIP